MTDEKNKNIIVARKIVSDIEYQILDTRNAINDICYLIIKLTDRQIIEVGQFKNIETAKEQLETLNEEDNIGRKVRIKHKDSPNIYMGIIMLWTFGELSRIEITGGIEGEPEVNHIIFYKFDDNNHELIEICEFID